MKKSFDRDHSKVYEGRFHKLTLWNISPATSLILKYHVDTSMIYSSKLIDSLNQIDLNSVQKKGEYFILQIDLKDTSRNGILFGMNKDVEYQSPNMDYKKNLDYLLNGLKEHIWFECSNGEQKLDFYSFERLWGLASFRRIQFGSSKINKDCKVVLDNIFPGLGRIKEKIQNVGQV